MEDLLVTLNYSDKIFRNFGHLASIFIVGILALVAKQKEDSIMHTIRQKKNNKIKNFYKNIKKMNQ